MCFFRKKKSKFPEIAKYKKGDFVNFRYKNQLYFGFIYGARVDIDNNVIYTLQIGGECPALVNDIKEESIIGYVK